MRMVTWNMQGSTNTVESKWSYAIQLFAPNVGVDVLCLQEAGDTHLGLVAAPAVPAWMAGVPPLCAYAYGELRLGSASRGAVVHMLWAQTDSGGNRVNLAICSQIAPGGLLWANPGLPGGRLALGMLINGIPVYCVHAFSGGGGDAAGLLSNVNATHPNALWYVLGDYNRRPDSLAPIVPFNVWNPGGPTHQSGGTLDYAVTSSRNNPTNAYIQQGGSWSDHLFVVYDT